MLIAQAAGCSSGIPKPIPSCSFPKSSVGDGETGTSRWTNGRFRSLETLICASDPERQLTGRSAAVPTHMRSFGTSKSIPESGHPFIRAKRPLRQAKPAALNDLDWDFAAIRVGSLSGGLRSKPT